MEDKTFKFITAKSVPTDFKIHFKDLRDVVMALGELPDPPSDTNVFNLKQNKVCVSTTRV